MARQLPFRLLILISLLGLLLLAIAPPQAVAASELFQIKRNRSTLCGRLVFLEDYKTQAKLIGLIPCNENRPLIFAARPGELYEFYRLTNVVIKKGDKVSTLAYGVLENYITEFDSFKEIYSCRECDSNAPPQAPLSAAQAGECSRWVLDQAEVAFPQINARQELQQLRGNLQAFANGTVVKQACGVDSLCRIGLTLQQLGVQLGPRLNWAGVTGEQTAVWLAGLLSDPAALEACPSLDVIAPKLVAGLDQQGHSLDLAVIGDACDLLASDARERRLGFQAGAPLQEIPGALAVANAGYQYLLYPSGSVARLAMACNQSDTVNLQLVQRDPSGIREYVFNRLPVQNKTRGEIDPAASPLILSLEPRGDGAVQERQPDRSLLHPALVAPIPSPTPVGTPAPASATPTPMPPSPTLMPAASLTPLPPSPTSTPAGTPTPVAGPRSGRNPLCPLAFGVAILPGTLLWQRKRSKGRIPISS
jgi:hypothetical protein